MPQPTSATTLQRPDLGVIAYEYMMAADQRGFIGQQVLPIFETPFKSADYPVIPVEAFMKIPKNLKRAPSADYSRGGWEFKTGTYKCEEYGHEEPVDDSEAALYQRYFDAETVATERITSVLMAAYEKRVADLVFNTGNITLTAAVTNEWDDPANATPKADVQAALKALRMARGVQGNAAVMTQTVFDNLLVCSELKTYLQYTSPHLIETRQAQLDMLAKYLGVERVLVATGMYDSADKGKAASIAELWDDEYVLLARLGGNARDLKEPCLGRTFLWTEDSPQLLVTESYREDKKRSNIIRVRQNVDEAFVFTGAGYLLSNITS